MSALQQLMQNGRLWRGRECDWQQPADASLGVTSGYAELDRALPFGGWPRGALTEILHPLPGQGEMHLLLPALRRLSRDQQYIVLINPPWVPYAPALAAAGIQLPFCLSIGRLDDNDRNWALEQILRAGQCGAVLAWPRQDLDNKTLRRLQLAAEAGNSCAFLLRHPRFRNQHSPAALRLQLHPGVTSPELEIIKCRGRNPLASYIQISMF